jgi:hypothetical protein
MLIFVGRNKESVGTLGAYLSLCDACLCFYLVHLAFVSTNEEEFGDEFCLRG